MNYGHPIVAVGIKKGNIQEIEIQNALIRGINKDMTDSIKYAQRIQQTILPDPKLLTHGNFCNELGE